MTFVFTTEARKHGGTESGAQPLSGCRPFSGSVIRVLLEVACATMRPASRLVIAGVGLAAVWVVRTPYGRDRFWHLWYREVCVPST